MKRIIPLCFAVLFFTAGCGSDSKNDPKPTPPTPAQGYMRLLLNGNSRDWSKPTATESAVGSYTYIKIKGTSSDQSESVEVSFDKPASQTWETATISYNTIAVKTSTKNVTYSGGRGTLKYDPATKVFSGTFSVAGGDPSVTNGTFEAAK